jgi:hypothetical protein
MTKRHAINLIILIAVVLCGTVPSYCLDLNALYHSDYKKFWSRWNAYKNAATSCTDLKATGGFLSEAVETIGNVEVSEANAEVIENLCLKNPKCFLNAIVLLSDANQRKVLSQFVAGAIYNDSKKMETSLSKYWNENKYHKTKKIYYSLKKGS